MSAGTKVTVSVRNNDVEFALRKFKNQVARNGNLSKAKERAEGYKKPGVRLKEEKNDLESDIEYNYKPIPKHEQYDIYDNMFI